MKNDPRSYEEFLFHIRSWHLIYFICIIKLIMLIPWAIVSTARRKEKRGK